MTLLEFTGAVIMGTCGGSLGTIITQRYGFLQKKEESKSAVTVEEIHDRKSLTDDQAAIIEKLQTRCDRMQDELFAAKEAIVDLKGKTADNARTIEALRDENRKGRQECEETIQRLTDDNVTLRAQYSTLQREHLLVASAFREMGGSVEEAVKQARRSTDKKDGD